MFILRNIYKTVAARAALFTKNMHQIVCLHTPGAKIAALPQPP